MLKDKKASYVYVSINVWIYSFSVRSFWRKDLSHLPLEECPWTRAALLLRERDFRLRQIINSHNKFIYWLNSQRLPQMQESRTFICAWCLPIPESSRPCLLNLGVALSSSASMSSYWLQLFYISVYTRVWFLFPQLYSQSVIDDIVIVWSVYCRCLTAAHITSRGWERRGGAGWGCSLLAHRWRNSITFHLHSNFVQIHRLFNGP